MCPVQTVTHVSGRSKNTNKNATFDALLQSIHFLGKVIDGPHLYPSKRTWQKMALQSRP